MKIVYLLQKLEPIAIRFVYIAGYLGLRGYSSKRARYGFPQRITISNDQLPSTAQSTQKTAYSTQNTVHITQPFYLVLRLRLVF
jgi:hypothetical protein